MIVGVLSTAWKLSQKGSQTMKRLIAALVALASFSPLASQAEGTQIGTAPILVATGGLNLSAQFQFGDKSALVARYNDFNGTTWQDITLDLTGYSLAYKGYLNSYADGPYFELGAASIDVAVSSSSAFTVGSMAVPIAVFGYEWTFGNNFVVGIEGGFGTAGGMGVFGVNTSYQF